MPNPRGTHLPLVSPISALIRDPMNAKTDIQAKAILKKWMEEGLLEEVTYKSESQRKDRKGVVTSGRVGEQN